jgi:predicted MFS family arabinose efflux permease
VGLSSGHRAYVLGVLTLIYTLAFVDRQIINILAEPIKRDLGLADWQMGTMSGFAFAMLYTAVGIPLARYAERANRPLIIGASLAIWSGFTALSGLAQSFVHIVLARVGVGIGEAGCVPASHSLISEITPPEKRASALAIFSAGLPMGSLFGMALGGLVASVHGWRTAFYLVGAPGIALAAILVLTVRDPRFASGTTRSERVPTEVPSLASALRLLLRKPSFGWLVAGASMLSFAGYSHQAFYGSFFMRSHGPQLSGLSAELGFSGTIGFLGLMLGLIIGITGTIGTALGGRLADSQAKTDRGRYMSVPYWASLAATPLLLAAFIVDDVVTAFVVLASSYLLKSMWYGPVFASVQGLVDPRTRATAVAVFLLLVNVIGLGLGPLAAGAVSDVLAASYGPAEGLRYSMILLCVFVAASAYCFRRAASTLGHDSVS